MDFSGFSYFFMDFSGCFAVVRGAVLWISAVSATFLEIFPAVYNIPKEIDIEFLRYPISRTLTIRNPLS